MSWGEVPKMVKTIAAHLCELDPPHHPAGGPSAMNGWRPLQRLIATWTFRNWEVRTLMAVLWGRCGGRSDAAWLARNPGRRGQGPTTALTRHGPHGDDAIGAIGALSRRSDRAQKMRLAQSTPHHFRRSGRRSAIRPLIAGAPASSRVTVMPAASIRLAPGAQTNGSDSARSLRSAHSVRVAKGRSR